MHPGEMEVLCRLRGDRAETEPPSRIQEGYFLNFLIFLNFLKYLEAPGGWSPSKTKGKERNS